MVICVTGPMAAGKNYVCRMIEELSPSRGIPLVSIDADVAGHQAVDLCTGEILAEFGSLAKEKGISLADENGRIIRRNLGSLIFGNAELVARQESIVFPKITEIIEGFIAGTRNAYPDGGVIVNATVLHKIPLAKKMDFVVFVDCPVIIRFFRAMKRDGIGAGAVLARFRSQKNLYKSYRSLGIPVYRLWNLGPDFLLKMQVCRLLKETAKKKQ